MAQYRLNEGMTIEIRDNEGVLDALDREGVFPPQVKLWPITMGSTIYIYRCDDQGGIAENPAITLHRVDTGVYR